MEITGPDRLSVASSITVAGKGLAKVQSEIIADAVVGSKLHGCKGTSIGAIMSRLRPNLGNGVSGVFTASDGVQTDPIELDQLVKGYILHTDASGAELPTSLGGPLRVIFPTGIAIQDSVCGTPKPVNVKGVIRLELHSEYELQELKVSQDICAQAPQMILTLEEMHMASLLAFARTFGGILQPAKVAVTGLDARGLTLCVTSSSGVVSEDLLAPFPRPLHSVSDVMLMVMEMHRTAFSEVDVAFKLRSRYYTEPIVVAARVALRSPHFNTVAAIALVTVGVASLGWARLGSRRR